LRVNDQIKAKEVRLVDSQGKQLGIKSIEEALKIAQGAELDLVEVSPFAKPPVCKLMDYSKFKFDENHKAREARKKSAANALKEMKYRPKIGSSDFENKTKQVSKFLEQGHKVKVTMMFRGREVFHPEFGYKVLEKVAEITQPIAKVEVAPKLDGKNLVMVLAPLKKGSKNSKEGLNLKQIKPQLDESIS
jgi:translation initiation factor IF-3